MLHIEFEVRDGTEGRTLIKRLTAKGWNVDRQVEQGPPPYVLIDAAKDTEWVSISEHVAPLIEGLTSVTVRNPARENTSP